MKRRRKIKYHLVCQSCKYEIDNEIEYLGYSAWYCPKCSSDHVHIEITAKIIEEEHIPKGEMQHDKSMCGV